MSPLDLVAFHTDCEDVVLELYSSAQANAPNFGVTQELFRDSLHTSLFKFLIKPHSRIPPIEEAHKFLESLQCDDLFLAIGCANGNELAWWEFDQQHRVYLERVARHLASTDLNAREVVDLVYVELYGTRITDGERVSKFATYSGKGSIRGWLRTVIWHSLVDMHRASHDEVSLDEMTDNVGEGFTHASFARSDLGGESEMLDHLARERYREATVTSIEQAFDNLDDHQKLLLYYYHVDNLKLREIARLAEVPTSPLRRWFQRKSANRAKNPSSKIHESTIMRWLEKTYQTVLDSFMKILHEEFALKDSEAAICIELATQDLANSNIYKKITIN